MRHMLLIIEEPGQRATRNEAEARAAYAAMQQFGERLRAQGQLVDVASLASHSQAARVSTAANGRLQVVDGPFAEAKEMIGGYFVLECDSREAALALAAECPAAAWCTVELRSFAPCFDDSRAPARLPAEPQAETASPAQG